MRFLALALLIPALALAGKPYGGQSGQQTNINSSESGSVAEAVSGSTATANNNLNVGGSRVDVKQGGARAGASATTGNSAATGGSVGNVSGGNAQGGTGFGIGTGGDGGSATGGAGGLGGNASAVSGDSSAISGDSSASADGGRAFGGAALGEGGDGGVGIGGTGVGGVAEGGTANVTGGGAIVSNSYRESISMAAPIYAGPCSEGFSGSGEDGGFSIQTINQYCQRINQANVMLAAWQFELNHNSEPWCDGVCTKKEASVTLKYKQSDKGIEYRDLYYENLDAAQAILDKTETTGLIGRWFQQMGGIVIAALLILAV